MVRSSPTTTTPRSRAPGSSGSSPACPTPTSTTRSGAGPSRGRPSTSRRAGLPATGSSATSPSTGDSLVYVLGERGLIRYDTAHGGDYFVRQTPSEIRSPDVSGGTIVWQEYDGNDWNIFWYTPQRADPSPSRTTPGTRWRRPSTGPASSGPTTAAGTGTSTRPTSPSRTPWASRWSWRPATRRTRSSPATGWSGRTTGTATGTSTSESLSGGAAGHRLHRDRRPGGAGDRRRPHRLGGQAERELGHLHVHRLLDGPRRPSRRRPRSSSRRRGRTRSRPTGTTGTPRPSRSGRRTSSSTAAATSSTDRASPAAAASGSPGPLSNVVVRNVRLTNWETGIRADDRHGLRDRDARRSATTTRGSSSRTRRTSGSGTTGSPPTTITGVVVSELREHDRSRERHLEDGRRLRRISTPRPWTSITFAIVVSSSDRHRDLGQRPRRRVRQPGPRGRDGDPRDGQPAHREECRDLLALSQ